MSVQNPERMVTKQDLADFYQGILPYLGGMPDILANKFSKGDMYSTDEKMIGQWTDGKPLYEKSFTFSTVTIPSNHDQLNFGDTSGLDVDMGFVSDVMVNNLNTYYQSQGAFACFFRKANSNFGIVNILNTSQVVATELIVTFKYTKTSDSAVSIGNDTDYSTTEKIIGTWIDGKTIWQKTISVSLSGGNSWQGFDHNIANLENCINSHGWLYHNSEYFNIPHVAHQAEATIGITVSSDKVFVLAVGRAVTAYITIQYTKTS